MTQAYKMVFIDLDGTTLNKEAEITPRTKQVLEHLDREGIPVVINTGRSIYSVRGLFTKIGNTIKSPVISLNGSVAFTQLDGPRKWYESIKETVVNQFLEICKENNEIDNLLFEGLDQYYTLYEDEDIQKFFTKTRKMPPNVINFDHAFEEPVTNLLIRPKEKNHELDEWVMEQLKDNLRIVKTQWHWMEGLIPYAHKGNAMKKIASEYGVSLDEVVAFGDEWNDVEMIEMAGLGVGMENGSAEIKELADLIAPHHDAEGVARTLEEIFADLLIETGYRK